LRFEQHIPKLQVVAFAVVKLSWKFGVAGFLLAGLKPAIQQNILVLSQRVLCWV
jgi:hypothetical protein